MHLCTGGVGRHRWAGGVDMAMTGMTDGEKRVLAGVMALPLGSAADIARVQDRTPSGVHARLRALRDQGLVDSVVLGVFASPGGAFLSD